MMKTFAVLLVATVSVGLAVARPSRQGEFLKTTNSSMSGGCSLVGCGAKQAPSGCWCDKECGCRGDCCSDFNPVCTGGHTGCSFDGCTGISCSAGGCSCAPNCGCAGNCCDDWNPVCTGGHTGCTFDGCGIYSCSGQCWCDKSCTVFGDCCSDYKDRCT